MSAELTSLQIALRLHGLGLNVIPVPRPRPGVPAGMPGDGKVPAIAWKQYQRCFQMDAEVHAMFNGDPMNLAVITGAISDIVVIDADALTALRWCTAHLPYTPWQTQTARGFHLWYRHPGVPVANRARLETRDGRLAIDVRGDGGFVIAPGSLHASGAEYLEGGDWTVPHAELPRFWPGLLQRPKRSDKLTYQPRPAGDLVERARRYLAAVPRPEIGSGSDNATLCAACRLVRGFGLCAVDAELLLWEWAGGRAGWTREWVAQKVARAERYGTEPIGALR
jgi:hypothetical protein